MPDIEQTRDELTDEIATLSKRLAELEGPAGEQASLEGQTSTPGDGQPRDIHALESMGRLTTGVAHEFSNLLTAIIGFAQSGASALPPQNRVKTNLEVIQKIAERAADLVNRLLSVSSTREWSPETISINDVVFEMDRLLRHVIGEHIELVTLTDPSLAFIEADPSHVEQVILSIALNARDAMPSGGRLYLETSQVEINTETTQDPDLPEGQYALLTVRDTGTGMSDNVKGQIFDSFYIDGEMGHVGGLGLSACYDLVTQNGGTITVDSEQGNGTSVKIYFPQIFEAPTARPTNIDEIRDFENGRTVLLVEDEAIVRQVMALILQERGFQVVEASNGFEALSVLGELDEPVHLVITDMVMPLMGGAELVKRLREINYQAKVLYTSGYTDEDVAKQRIAEEGYSFLAKPFTPDTLVQKVMNVLA